MFILDSYMQCGEGGGGDGDGTTWKKNGTEVKTKGIMTHKKKVIEETNSLNNPKK